MRERDDGFDPAKEVMRLRALGYSSEEIRRKAGNHLEPTRGSAQHLARMTFLERERYGREVLGRMGDASFHPAVLASEMAGNRHVFVAPPKGLPRTHLAQRGFASRRYRYS